MNRTVYVVPPTKRMPAASVPPHIHNCYELIYYLKGSGKTYYRAPSEERMSKTALTYLTDRMNGPFYRFSAHDYILFPPNVIHNETYEQPSLTFSIVFESDADLSFCNLLLSDKLLTVKNYVDRICRELTEKQYDYMGCINALLSQLTITLQRENSRTNFPIGGIGEAISFLNDYYTSHIELNDLAASAGYSVEHFRTLFKKQTGCSPKEYILKKRMDLAVGLLCDPSLSFKVIAQTCGYEDYVQFNNIFKKRYGSSPTDYRNNLKSM